MSIDITTSSAVANTSDMAIRHTWLYAAGWPEGTELDWFLQLVGHMKAWNWTPTEVSMRLHYKRGAIVGVTLEREHIPIWLAIANGGCGLPWTVEVWPWMDVTLHAITPSLDTARMIAMLAARVRWNRDAENIGGTIAARFRPLSDQQWHQLSP